MTEKKGASYLASLSSREYEAKTGEPKSSYDQPASDYYHDKAPPGQVDRPPAWNFIGQPIDEMTDEQQIGEFYFLLGNALRDIEQLRPHYKASQCINDFIALREELKRDGLADPAKKALIQIAEQYGAKVEL